MAALCMSLFFPSAFVIFIYSQTHGASENQTLLCSQQIPPPTSLADGRRQTPSQVQNRRSVCKVLALLPVLLFGPMVRDTWRKNRKCVRHDYLFTTGWCVTAFRQQVYTAAAGVFSFFKGLTHSEQSHYYF